MERPRTAPERPLRCVFLDFRERSGPALGRDGFLHWAYPKPDGQVLPFLRCVHTHTGDGSDQFSRVNSPANMLFESGLSIPSRSLPRSSVALRFSAVFDSTTVNIHASRTGWAGALRCSTNRPLWRGLDIPAGMLQQQSGAKVLLPVRSDRDAQAIDRRSEFLRLATRRFLGKMPPLFRRCV